MTVFNYNSPDFVPPFFSRHDLPVPNESDKKVLAGTLRESGISQPHLAKSTGLSQQSVSRIVIRLKERGLLSERERKSKGRRGQPSETVAVTPDFAYSFGVAMMTDAISIVLMDFSGQVLDQLNRSMPTMSRQVVLSELQKTFQKLIHKHGIDPQKIFGMGVGISGYTLGGRARYNTPRALDDWALVEIDEIMSEHLNLPAWVENDANVAAIGENLVGIGRNYKNFAYLYIDAGIGGGIIVEQKLMRGCNGNGGEIGLILPSQIYPHPSLEVLRQTLARKGIGIEGIADMLSKFDPSWEGVDEWISKSHESFSLIVSALAAILDTEAIVLGGRIPTSLAEKVIPHIEIYDDARRAEPRPMPRLLVSQSTGDACAIGAATLPFNRYFFSA